MGTWGTWNNVQGHGTMDMVMGNTSIFPSGDIVGHCWTWLDIGGHCWTLLDIVGHWRT